MDNALHKIRSPLALCRHMSNIYELATFSCGVMGCTDYMCDACYPGHFLEVHMFAPGQLFWRDANYRFSRQYRPETIKRAEFGKQLIHG